MLIIKISQFLRRTQKLTFTHTKVEGLLASRATFRPSMENQEMRGEDGHAASRRARIRARHAHWSRRDRRVGRTGSIGARGFPMEGPSGNDRWFPFPGTGDTGGPELLHR
ncbi:hypothetical protein Cmtc_47190 [Cupriavidus sp. TKC]|nr:hypothetical protein Cmtc_47190 [Cupriavidus sp. TKC]